MDFFIRTLVVGCLQLMASSLHHPDLAGMNYPVAVWGAVSAISQVAYHLEDMAACAVRCLAISVAWAVLWDTPAASHT